MVEFPRWNELRRFFTSDLLIECGRQTKTQSKSKSRSPVRADEWMTLNLDLWESVLSVEMVNYQSFITFACSMDASSTLWMMLDRAERRAVPLRNPESKLRKREQVTAAAAAVCNVRYLPRGWNVRTVRDWRPFSLWREQQLRWLFVYNSLMVWLGSIQGYSTS